MEAPRSFRLRIFTRGATGVPSGNVAHTRRLDDFWPFVEIVAEISLELRGVSAFGFDTETAETLARLGILQKPADIRRDLLDDARRRAARREEAVPHVHFEARQTGLGDRRHVGKQL